QTCFQSTVSRYYGQVTFTCGRLLNTRRFLKVILCSWFTGSWAVMSTSHLAGFGPVTTLLPRKYGHKSFVSLPPTSSIRTGCCKRGSWLCASGSQSLSKG